MPETTSLSDLPKAVMVFQPHLMPPPGSYFFDLHDKMTPLVANPGVAQELARFMVDTGSRGWLRKLGITCESFDSAIFRIRRSGSLVPFYENINVELGTVELPADVWIQLNPGDLLTFETVAAANTAARWRLQGWIYPTSVSEY